MAIGNHIYGIEVTEVNSQLRYHVVVLKVSRAKELSIVDTFEKSSLEEVISEIPKYSQVSLVFNTSAVLVKSLGFNELNLSPEEAFPQLDFESFFIEEVEFEKQKLISLCRKKEVEQILKLMEHNQLYITNFNLGYAVLGVTRDFFKEAKPIFINQKNFEVSKSEIRVKDNDSGTEQKLSIEGESIHASKLLAFSTAYQSITSSLTNTNNYKILLENQQKEFNLQKNFKLILKAGIATLLIVFLINFIAYSYYFSKVKDIDTNQFKQMLALQDKLSNSVDSLNSIYNQTQSNNISKVTFYVDQIVALAPKNIILNEFIFQPETRPYNEDKKQLYLAENKIQIEAQVANETDFELWVARLNQLTFVEKTEVQNFNKESSKRYHTVNFSILVKE